jgi:hypothetical protein
VLGPPTVSSSVAGVALGRALPVQPAEYQVRLAHGWMASTMDVLPLLLLLLLGDCPCIGGPLLSPSGVVLKSMQP